MNINKIKPKGEKDNMAVKIDKDKCTACGSCVDVCPVDAITIENIAVVDEDTCIDCGTCVGECPVEAIEL